MDHSYRPAAPAPTLLVFLSVASLLLTMLAMALCSLALHRLHAQPSLEVIALSQPTDAPASAPSDEPSSPPLVENMSTPPTPLYQVRLADQGESGLGTLGIFDSDDALVEQRAVALATLREEDRKSVV